MKYISRSQWYGSLVTDLLQNNNQQKLECLLFTSEVKRIEKRYPVSIGIGPVISATDRRHSCVITKREDA